MEQAILKQIALILIANINECSKLIKDLEMKLKNKITHKDIDTTVKEILKKFEDIIKCSENKFVLPEKIIDNILMLMIKFLDISFSNSNLIDLNNFISIFIHMIIKFLNIEQNFLNLNLNKKEFFNKKWKYIENILIFTLSLIDKYDPTSKNNYAIDLQTILKSIFEFLEITYFLIDNNENKYKIMPGIISKMIKLISLNNLKLNSRLLKIVLNIFNDNLNLIFIIFTDYKSFPNVETNLVTFLDFYNVLHILIKEKINKNKIEKIISELCEMNLNLINKIVKHKEKLEFVTTLKNNYEEVIFNRNQNIFYLLNTYIFNSSCPDLYNSNFFVTYKQIFNDNKKISEKLNENIKIISRAIDKEEFHKINHNFPELFANINLFLSNISKSEIKYLLTDKKSDDVIKVLEMESDNNFDSTITNILENFYENVLVKLIKLQDNLIFEIVNIYEIQINNVSKSDCMVKCKNLFLKCVKNEKEIEIGSLWKILNLLYKEYPDIFVLFFNLNMKNMYKNVKIFKKMLEFEENSLKIKEIQDNFEQTLRGFALFIFTSIYPIYYNKDIFNSESNNLISKNNLTIKQYVSYFSTLIDEYHDQLECIKSNKILFFKSILLIINSYLFHYNKRIFNNQEKNSCLIIALTNYSNKAELLKMSSILLLHELSSSSNLNSKEEKLELKSFVISNFDFIINTTINKIIYFNINKNNSKQNDKKALLTSISNFKIDILNFFNSLILLLKEINDENLINNYCGELNKFMKKLFNYMDLFYKEKNFFNLECLLEIIEKITSFQNEVISKNFALFKSDCYEDFIVSEIENESSNKFVEFLKVKIGMSDTNIFRNLILRILPLLISGKASIIYKTLKIFGNLISTLYLLPMTREEKTNFSTEDPSNVLIKSSLAPVMFESWEYFLYIMGRNNKVGKLTIQNVKLIFELLIEVSQHYDKFFTETRLFTDLIPLIDENISILAKKYSFEQIHNLYSSIIEFFYQINNKKMNLKIKTERKSIYSEENSKALISFFEKFVKIGGGKLSLEDHQKITGIFENLNLEITEQLIN